MNRRIQISAITCASVIVIISLGSPFVSEAYAEACVGSGPQICVDFLDAGDPFINDDFTVDFTDPANPDVTLITGSLFWQVRSRVGPPPNDTPANIGDITLNPAVNTDDFGVKIASGVGFGAANVGVINLDDAGFTGSSSIAGISLILGDLGGLTLVNGGVLDQLFVVGDLTGPLTVPTLKGGMFSAIDGNVIGDADITIGKIENGSFTIGLSLVCSAAACPDITVTEKIYDGSLTVTYDVPSGSIITINELEEPNPPVGGLTVVDLSNAGEFAGTLDLPLGLANANTLIDVGGTFSGVIDFHGGAVVGDIAIYIGTTTAEIKNGGAVSGVVYLSQNIPAQDYQYEGTATFASVTSTGEIGTQTIGPPAHFPGILNVTNGVAGVIEIAGSHLLGAEINIGGPVSGDIEISEDCIGLVSIDGDVKGDIDIQGSLSGIITVGSALSNGGAGGGRILVTGESSGAIKVGEKTASLTLIQVAGGLASGATIEINTTQGAFDARGDIHIGGTTPAALPFDGCIRIYDDSTSGNHGDLFGAIDIVACHADGEILNICIDGKDGGNITLDQTGCVPANATWSCGTCP